MGSEMCIRDRNKGDVFAVSCAGGAGHGRAENRLRASIEDDILDGYISIEEAKRSYGWSEKKRR